MATVRAFKKNLNCVLGDVIETVCVWECAHPNKDRKNSDAIIDSAIEVFDVLTAKINAKPTGSAKAHFKAIASELQEKHLALVKKISELD